MDSVEVGQRWVFNGHEVEVLEVYTRAGQTDRTVRLRFVEFGGKDSHFWEYERCMLNGTSFSHPQVFGIFGWSPPPTKPDPEAIRRQNRRIVMGRTPPDWVTKTIWSDGKYQSMEKRWNAAMSALLNRCNDRPEPVEVTDEMMARVEEEVRFA